MSEARPTSVVRFEKMAYLGIFLTIASWPLNWQGMSASLARSPLIYPIGIGVGFAVQVLLIWLIARRRKNWARWAIAVLIIVGLAAIPLELHAFVVDPMATAGRHVGYLVWVVAVAFLFRRDAREWFESKTASPAAP